MKVDIDFWCSSTRDTYREVFNSLVNYGMSKEEANKILEKLYYATSEEYGG